MAGELGAFASEAGDIAIFSGITIFTVTFASIVLLMLKPLKRLTHGAEDNEREMLEQEPYELADTEIN
ncbi:POT family proton-dependent oligopeptide transporter [Gillisia sp. Hel_I_86]|nr:POT family proton-dependent oligopeptide transporter [Gillisia sp. Hel_I_86]